MKLSCSAYQASSSTYAQKILSSQHSNQNYGATSSSMNPTDSSHGIVMPTWNVEEIEGKSPNSETEFGAADVSSSYQQGGVVGTSSACGGGGGASGRPPESRRSTSSSLSHHSDGNHPDPRGSDSTSISKAPATSSCSESPAHRLSEHSRSRSKSVGEQQWTNLRAVLAWYARLRRIKRSKSNQRWMKLRTTVQLSGAIQTIQQKKAPLKREDSFLKRFSTRQIPEAQETFEIGDEDGAGGGGSDWSKKGRKKRRSLPRSVVSPDSNFYFYWLMVLTICVLYNLWTLIVRQSFPELQEKSQLTWILADSFCDLVFLLDIAVQLRTGYLEQGLMVYQTKKLATHYIGSKPFYFDICSLIPTDLFQLYFGINPMLRFPRFLKVYRISHYYYMVESRTVFPNVWRVVNLIHVLLLLAHWFGCFYYLISEAEEFNTYWGYPNPKHPEHIEFSTLSRKYLGSLYWSTLTLTTIGDLPPPESNRHTMTKAGRQSRTYKSRLHYIHSDRGFIFTIVSYLIGVFIFATIVGQVGNVITNRNANRLEFERLLDGAKMYMRHHKVPRDMQRRVLRWYDYSWSRGRIQGGGDINTALGLLPDKLKTELALHVNLSVLKKVTIFQECQPEFLHDLVLKMKAYIFTPGDLICRKGEVAREMFIIADGILEVISETGKVLTTMEAGDFFGEIGILNLDGLNKRTADVRSVGYSELFSLSREDVLAAMKDYPEAQDILQTLGRKRLMEARKASAPAPKKIPPDVKTICPVDVVGLAQSQSTHSQLHLTSAAESGSNVDSNAGKRIVEKLKSDVKGLRNAIRKSRKSNSSKDDSSEAESGKTDGECSSKKRKESSFPTPRGVLKRMHNVVLSDEKDPSSPSTPTIGKPSFRSVLSAATKRVQLPRTPPQPSPPVSTPDPQEIIGAGLPLMQRLRLLKQKEDRERKQQEERDAMMKTLIPSNLSLTPPTVSPILQTKATVEPITIDHVSQRGSSVSSMKEIIRASGASTSSPASSSLPIFGTFSPKSTLLIGEAAAVAVLKITAEPANPMTSSFPPVWPLSAPPRESTSSTATADVHEESSLVFQATERPSALQLRQQHAAKNYGSVDDLSPEFSRLPFIKKLKILNERQKIAELLMTKSGNSVLTRSTSEGSNENPSVPGDIIVEAHSLHSVPLGRRSQSSREHDDNVISSQPYIPLCESNDHVKIEELASDPNPPSSTSPTQATSSTQAKRKKRRTNKTVVTRESGGPGVLGDGNEGSTEDSSPSPPISPDKSDGNGADMDGEEQRRLMRSPTVQGYAARHPPDYQQQQTLTTTALQKSGQRSLSPENFQTLTSLLMSEESEISHPQPPRTHLKLAQEECIGSVVLGIKTIIQSKINEIQSNFQNRFDLLEYEVMKRDDMIVILQDRIQELENKSGDETSFRSNGNFQSTRNHPSSSTRRQNHIGSSIQPGDDDDDDDENDSEIEYDRSNQHVVTPSSYLFSRGDSIDTVISAGDYDEDEVFEESLNQAPSSSSATRRRREGAAAAERTNYVSTWAEDQDRVATSDISQESWQLEFHRDRDSLPPPNGLRGESVALEMGNTSTEYESSDEDDDGGAIKSGEQTQLKETNVNLDDDEEAYEKPDSDSETSDNSINFDNKDWEIQLLAKEMEKREEQKKPAPTSKAVDEMRELENEIEEMKQAVNTGSLSPSDLDMLESFLETKTKRMKVLCKAISVESAATTTLFASKLDDDSKSKVGRSYDDFRRGSGSSAGGASQLPTKEPKSFLDVQKLFSRRTKESGGLTRQSSLYEKANKGNVAKGGGTGRRESAGAIFSAAGASWTDGKRKQSFLSRFTLVRQLTKYTNPHDQSFVEDISQEATADNQKTTSSDETKEMESVNICKVDEKVEQSEPLLK